MDENRAAAPGDPRPDVMVDFNEKVVEGVAAPKPVTWFSGRAGHRAVIIAVAGVLAPGRSPANSAGRQRALRSMQSIRPPPQSQRAKPAPRRPAIPFAFVGLDAAPPQRHWQRQRTG